MQTRHPFKVPVTYQMMGRESHTSEGEAINISSGGISMRNHLRIEKGTLIQVMVPISEHMVMVPVISEVAWSEEESSGSYHAGLKFLK